MWVSEDTNSVREGGLEPPRPIRALAPQASASAISAIRAQWRLFNQNRRRTRIARLRRLIHSRCERVRW